MHIDTVHFSSKMYSMKVKRTIESKIKEFLTKKTTDNILFIWGPRRSGKTTLLQKFAKEMNAPIFNFDFVSDRQRFVPTEDSLQKLAQENKIIFIDEIQNYPAATLPIKILNDVYKIKVVATGSSELRQKAGEDFDTMAGRFQEMYCLPLSIEEIHDYANVDTHDEGLFERNLIKNLSMFGAYPEVYLSKSSESYKIKRLEKIIEAYVLKDIIDIYNLKNIKLAKDILTKVALQLGSEVSVREIANSLQANIGTVTSYIEIFIKNYILIPLPSFKTNTRKAVSENRKLYFYDLGIRNALIKDFREVELRPDAGGLWENLVVIEFEKRKRIKGLLQTHYFYREYGGKEVDFIIEDYKKNYTCVEIKERKGKMNNIFPLPHKSKVITKDNFVEEFV